MFGSKYFKWYIRGESIIAEAREENPYRHHCPLDHFQTVVYTIIEAFNEQNILNTDVIFSMLEDEGFSPDRPFRGKAEEYKIRITLGILEIEELLKWTGSKRPIEYILAQSTEKIKSWLKKIKTTRISHNN